MKVLNCSKKMKRTDRYAQGWGTALDGADGDVATYLLSRGAKRSDQGVGHGTSRYELSNDICVSHFLSNSLKLSETIAR